MIQRSTESNSNLQLDELIHRFLQQIDEGQTPDRGAMLRDNPQLAAELAEFFDDHDLISRFALEVRADDCAKSSGDTATGGLPRAVRYFGRYEILEEIARGGMGVVYKARQTRLDRLVALKMILSGRLASTADVSRFQSEAQAAAKLEHPGIVPIYEVGQVAGQHYFSMAYVDGESLAARIAAGPLPQHDAAQIVRQLCDAVQYAHQHGVIHRDLKPANVLIDGEGRVRITDFGLAKQTAAGNSLTATGEILGTPSYMPPEQAAGDLTAAGPAADIYSLGAILYATLTGRPPFQADTPAETVHHVRNSDPLSPCSFNPRISRDLETICLKCLEKDPSERYATAAAMNEDLRRFLHDEPIVARRIGPIRRSGRWIKKRRKFISTVVASAALAAGGVAAVFFAIRSHDQSAIGTLSLSTSGSNLVAEVLDRNGKPDAPAFSVPTSQPLEVDAGDYRLRVSAPGQLSQDYSLHVDAGAKLNYQLQMENRLLWQPIQLAADEVYDPIPFGNRNNILVYRASDHSVRLIDGATGKYCWSHELVLDESNLPAGESLDEWTKLLSADLNAPWEPGWALAPADGSPASGDPTLVLASRVTPALVAVSAKTGKVIWLFRGQPHPWADWQPMSGEVAPVVGSPLVVRPNGKTTAEAAAGPVVVACFYHPSWDPGAKGKAAVNGGAQAWIECVSLKTGKTVWRYDFTSYSGGKSFMERAPWSLVTSGEPRLVSVSGKQIVISAVDKKLYAVDLATGRDAFPPFELGFQPDAPCKLLNDGSAAPIAIFASGRKPGRWFLEPQKVTLSAIALDAPRRIWQTAVEQISPYHSPNEPPSDITEFEIEPIGERGEPTIVAPSWHFDPKMWTNKKRLPHFNLERGYSSLAAFDAKTGKPKWDFPLAKSDQALDWRHARWTLGSDLNGDGYRDLFATWIDNELPDNCSLVVAAISGRDGKQLWRWTQPHISGDENRGVIPIAPQAELSWWSPAADGLPKLVVAIAHGIGGQPRTYLLDAADGHVLQTISGVCDAQSVALADSGMPDLLYSQKSQEYSQLMAARGGPTTVWRPLANGNLSVADDFDSDGITDVISTGWPFTALSGRDGHELFHFDNNDMNTVASAILPSGAAGKLRPAILNTSLHRDTPSFPSEANDIIALDADGHQLWRFTNSPPEKSGNGFGAVRVGRDVSKYPALGGISLARTRPDVWLAELSEFDERERLTILAGDTGKLRLQTLIAPGQFGRNGQFFRDEFQDLDGDGVRDIIVWTPTNDKKKWQLKAFSGADCKPLWPDAAPIYASAEEHWAAFNLPSVGDLEGNGHSDVVFVRPRDKAPNQQGESYELVCVDGRTGRAKWTWSWINLFPPDAEPLLVDFDGTGRRSICLFIKNVTVNSRFAYDTQPQVVILDGQGVLRRRIRLNKPVAGPKPEFFVNLSWWQKASTGDGKEVLLVDMGDTGEELCAVGGPKLETRWRWPLSDRPTEVMEVFAPSPEKPAAIALSIDSTMLGISAATGKPIWRGETVPDKNGEMEGPHDHVLLENEHSNLPLLLTREGCRQVWPADASGRYEYPLATPRKN